MKLGQAASTHSKIQQGFWPRLEAFPVRVKPGILIQKNASPTGTRDQAPSLLGPACIPECQGSLMGASRFRPTPREKVPDAAQRRSKGEMIRLNRYWDHIGIGSGNHPQVYLPVAPSLILRK